MVFTVGVNNSYFLLSKFATILITAKERTGQRSDNKKRIMNFYCYYRRPLSFNLYRHHQLVSSSFSHGSSSRSSCIVLVLFSVRLSRLPGNPSVDKSKNKTKVHFTLKYTLCIFAAYYLTNL